MDGTVLPTVPPLVLHGGVTKEQVDVEGVCAQWLKALEILFTTRSFDSLSPLLIDNCWWRDIVGLSWDFTSKHGYDAISAFLADAPNPITELQLIKDGGLKPLLLDIGGMIWIHAAFSFKNQHGEGTGILRLVHVDKSEWKAWLVSTQLDNLHVTKNATAPSSAAVDDKSTGTEDQSLQVLIVGAGQAGLALGTRLKSMGISALIVDKNDRIGGAWTNRYQSVTLNTPKYTDHFPFMKLPEGGPAYLSGRQMVDFMERYGKEMGLAIELSTQVTKADYDSGNRRYNVEVQGKGGEKRVFSTKHVVLATGVFSEEAIIPEIASPDVFNGLVYHSGEHKSASQVPDLGNKRVVVVGCGSTGHDIAADFVTGGAKEVTLFQRNPIFTVSDKAIESILLPIWNMEGVTTEEADVLGNSLPLKLIRAVSIDLTRLMCAHDKAIIDGLKKAGMALRTGEDGYGLADYQLIHGGRFYIDRGASQMIIDGRIKILRCEGGVSAFHPSGLTLADGTQVDADVVVYATGYRGVEVTVERLMGSEIAEKVGAIGSLDAENERVGWWRPTGAPGFWYMTGSFMWCRQFSLPLALQISAIERGLNNDHYE
ncbi:putative flavin-containing monooxygenase [Rosellinia necatrix]|uniref:Putative flavin-containing monooxygenase n=1 Tax=Rosellinia necatrix TaxID=77044 RepID=A0A1S7UL20_ROSNE|nr:putative flavin-containing monooxygenase [Rosellinia necatrix]